MGSEEHVFQLEKWVAFGDRFSLEDIDDRARDRFRSEGVTIFFSEIEKLIVRFFSSR